MATTDQPIKIRRGLVADALSVHAALWAARDDIPLTPKFEREGYRKWVRDHCRNRQVYIAEVGGKLAGVMVMETAEIFYLVTAPAYRKCGVGRALVRHAVSMIYRRYRCGVTAKARPGNLPIIQLLTGEGFRPHPILSTANPDWLVYFVGDVP